MWQLCLHLHPLTLQAALAAPGISLLPPESIAATTHPTGVPQSLARCYPRILAGATLCFVGVDGCYAGLFAAQDTPRPEATEALEQLQSLGVATAMLTGDGAGAAQAVAAATGLPPERVHASLLPHDKLELVSVVLWKGWDGVGPFFKDIRHSWYSYLSA